jgi:hypothetical protein
MKNSEAKNKKGNRRGIPNRKLDPVLSSARQLWQQNYHKKEKSGVDFDTFLKLSRQNCHYCGRKPFRVYNVGNSTCNYRSDYQRRNGNFVYNGVDRIDNTKPHTTENLVTCCWHCNRAKATMTAQEFIEWVTLVYHHLTNSVLPSPCTPSQ